jgi:hypothetical protein
MKEVHNVRPQRSLEIAAMLEDARPSYVAIRRELRRAFPDVKIEADGLRSELIQEVLKREVTEDEKAEEARRKIAKAQGRPLRTRGKGSDASGEEEAPAQPSVNSKP